METATVTLADFLLARIAEDEAPSWVLEPFACPPGCCAPEGWVGHRCLICQDGTSYGGTVSAIEAVAREHADHVHRRPRVLAECEAKRRIVDDRLMRECTPERHYSISGERLLSYLALPYADHPDYRDEWRP